MIQSMSFFMTHLNFDNFFFDLISNMCDFLTNGSSMFFFNFQFSAEISTSLIGFNLSEFFNMP